MMGWEKEILCDKCDSIGIIIEYDLRLFDVRRIG